MAFRINSNIAALNALRHLHDTEEALSTNLERLSSGRKLNHASADPGQNNVALLPALDGSLAGNPGSGRGG